MEEMSTRRYIGTLDIGGTKILAGIIDPSGALVARQRIKTQAKHGPEDVIARAANALQGLAQLARVPLSALEGVGCSVPGPLERESGVVLFSPNLGWRDVQFAELLEEQLDLPVEIEDDARCAALGEAWKGAARGASNAVYLTISTGIGSGVIINGQIYRGTHGFAGEVGHITLDAEALKVALGIETKGGVRITGATRRAQLPLNPASTPDRQRDYIAFLEKEHERFTREGDARRAWDIEMRLNVAQYRLYNREHMQLPYLPAEVTALGIQGEGASIGLVSEPAELFCYYGIQARAPTA